MKYWLDPQTGVCHDVPNDGLIAMRDRMEFVCVRCDVHHTLSGWSARHVFPHDNNAARVALYYRSYWQDCQLPAYAPASRDWGQLWRGMLGWLYSNDAGRESVLKAWDVFRGSRLEWLKYGRLFSEVYKQLYDQLTQAVVRPSAFQSQLGQGYDPVENVLVIQREQLPVDNTWVVDERKFDRTFVRVEGTLHDEEVPLYLVVHIPWDAITPSMVWVVGRDRHTGTLFALRVPAQFRYLDAALRWTMRAEPWDSVVEI